MPQSIYRLFVAVYPTKEAAHAMLALATARGVAQPHRLSLVDQVHMSLQFIGETPEREIKSVAESVRRSAAGVEPFELRPRRLLTLPMKGPARLMAVETDAPGPLLEVQRRLSLRLARKPRADAVFRPHLTVLRYGAGVGQVQVDEAVDVPSFEVTEVVLVRSILRPEGAAHVAVERVALD